MSAYHSIEINADGPTGRGVEVLLDGKAINGITRLSLSMAAVEVTKIQIELIPGSLNVSLPMLEEGKGIVLAESGAEKTPAPIEQWAVMVRRGDGVRRLLMVATRDGAGGIRSEVTAAFGEDAEIEECIRA